MDMALYKLQRQLPNRWQRIGSIEDDLAVSTNVPSVPPSDHASLWFELILFACRVAWLC